MKTRPYNPDSDYVEVASWWVDRTQVLPAKGLLGNTGILVTTDTGIPLAFVAVYGAVEGQTVAFLGFAATNPDPLWAYLTHEASLLAVRSAGAMSMAAGCSYVLTYTDVRALRDTYLKAGFVEGSKGTLSDFILPIGV